jgi:hypothetical protein
MFWSPAVATVSSSAFTGNVARAMAIAAYVNLCIRLLLVMKM